MINIDFNKITIVGFDLDDTLHHFQKASGSASRLTLTALTAKLNQPLQVLENNYAAILKNMQRHHFTRDIPSRKYRRERFQALLKKINSDTSKLIDFCLDAYDANLEKNLKLKDGAKQILQTVKSLNNKKIIIITEGPQDAQETTLKRLKIDHFIDNLYASSNHQISKTDGLFQIALNDQKCHPENMLFVGDNHQRDIIPARNLGIQTIHLDESNSDKSKENTISSLTELNTYLQRKP